MGPLAHVDRIDLMLGEACAPKVRLQRLVIDNLLGGGLDVAPPSRLMGLCIHVNGVSLLEHHKEPGALRPVHCKKVLHL